MGLSVVFGGSIIMMLIIVTISLTYVGTHQTFTQSITNSQVNNNENEISKTDIKISSLDGCSGSNIVNFTLANNGIEKLSNYDQFNLLITYDAQTGGPSDPVRITEQFVYNADAFSASTALSPQEKEIPHNYVQVTSRHSTDSGVFVDIPASIINRTSFDIDKKYLIYATAQFNMNDGSETASIRLAHSGIGFTGSEYSLEPNGGDSYYTYTWFTVWNPTTVAEADQDITLQFRRTTTDGGDFVRVELVTLFAMEISDHLTEDTDWFFDDDATAAQALPNTWTAVNNAAVTFTPNCPNDDWLVMATAQLDPASGGLNYETRLEATGGVTNSVDHLSREGEDAANDLIIQTIVHTYTIPAVSTTFTSQSQNDGGGISGTREYSAVFVINLDKFKNHKSVSELGKLDVSNIPDFVTEVQSLTFTPEEVGDAWILGYFIMNGNNGNGFHARMQSYETGQSEVDTPSSQTTDLLRLSRQWDASDELAFAIQTVERLDSISYTVNIDADTFTDTNLGYDAEARVISFVSMITEECVGGDPDSLLQINEWTINCIMNDNFELGIINTHEAAQISLKTEYPMFPGGILEASISTKNGSTDSKIVLVQ